LPAGSQRKEIRVISGTTNLLPLFGYPTKAFKAPLIYNPWFEKNGIDAVVVPMGVKPENYATVLKSVFQLSNIPGALVTMPHKVTTVDLLDEVTTAVKIAGSCNAIVKRPDGTLLGDIFDGTGFTRGLRRKGFVFAGAKCLVVGSGGVGSAIAAALAAEGVEQITVADTRAESAAGLAERLRQHYPKLLARSGSNAAAGYDLVVNGTPLGLPGDPLPIEISGLSPATFVGEVVMKTEMTPLLQAAKERGCRFQIGTDMLFEMIPAYLEFFGYGTTTAEELRALSSVVY
jgi:shikimate dehydrogenase